MKNEPADLSNMMMIGNRAFIYVWQKIRKTKNSAVLRYLSVVLFFIKKKFNHFADFHYNKFPSLKPLISVDGNS